MAQKENSPAQASNLGMKSSPNSASSIQGAQQAFATPQSEIQPPQQGLSSQQPEQEEQGERQGAPEYNNVADILVDALFRYVLGIDNEIKNKPANEQMEYLEKELTPIIEQYNELKEGASPLFKNKLDGIADKIDTLQTNFAIQKSLIENAPKQKQKLEQEESTAQEQERHLDIRPQSESPAKKEVEASKEKNSYVTISALGKERLKKFKKEKSLKQEPGLGQSKKEAQQGSDLNVPPPQLDRLKQPTYVDKKESPKEKIGSKSKSDGPQERQKNERQLFAVGTQPNFALLAGAALNSENRLSAKQMTELRQAKKTKNKNQFKRSQSI